MVAIAEAISEFKPRGRRQLRRTSVCSAENPRFCSFSRLFVDRCSLTVDDGQGPAGYPGAAALSRAGRGTGFRGVDAEHNCGELRSLPLNINGANTYQFVMNNPVGSTDPNGQAKVNPTKPPTPPSPPTAGAPWWGNVHVKPTGNLKPNGNGFSGSLAGTIGATCPMPPIPILPPNWKWWLWVNLSGSESFPHGGLGGTSVILGIGWSP